MAQPKYQRRKDERPRELAEAALAEFSEHGYAATRVSDVAKRAGVSKGLMYLYFKTKEELFKAVVRQFLVPRIDALEQLAASEFDSVEDFIRGPLASFLKTIPDTPVRFVFRLMVAEAHNHPDLRQFYWDNVVSRGKATLEKILRHGVERGEFRNASLMRSPQLLIAPALVAMLWRLLFDDFDRLDVDQIVDTQIDALLLLLKNEDGGSS